MNIRIRINGLDVTNDCRLQDTRINYDSSRRITTASLTVMGRAINRSARYDYANYDEDRYAIGLRELYEVVILDARDGTTKLFDGQIFSLEMEHSDGKDFEIYYRCELNDWAAWLDRSVCWDSSFNLPLPASDRAIITALLTAFCPRITLASIGELVPVIMSFDWLSKTARQVLDDIAALSMGDWRVDFDGGLHYGPASAAPAAPFELSTSPDFVTRFPVNVSSYRHDFTNPVNRAYVRGATDPESGAFVEASYSDPLSIAQYGEYATAVVDEQITTAWDASLKAKSAVLANSAPIEQGSFTIWKDGLQCGMKVRITEENLGIDGEYTIRALTMQWEDKGVVRYEAQFGGAQPDLETLLRIIEQRSRWKTTTQPTTTLGSITDDHIAPPGLSAGSIVSVNANTILGQIVSGQIESVNAGAIVGAITAGQIASVNAGVIQGAIVAEQIDSVNATTIEGAIVAGQIASVNAVTIQGVIVSQQLADQIISDLAKYADALRPVRVVKIGDPWPPVMPNKDYPAKSFFYYEPDGHFYRVNDDGMFWTQNDNPQGSLTNFYSIGRISATSITGLIVAAQIQSITADKITGAIQAGQIASITAGQITGQLSATQIGSVNASSISGQVTAAQIASVNATVIQGAITSDQIASIAATKISGLINADQIDTVNATDITGSIVSTQIGSINAATITVGLIGDSQIGTVSGAKLIAHTISSQKLDSYSIDVGAGDIAGRIRVINASSQVIGQIGSLDTGGLYGGWFRVFGAGGTYYGDANVRTDTGGNLYITNANFSVSGSGCTLSTSPSTFDTGGGYTSLTLNNADGSDRCAHITRGILLYYSGSKVGGFNRAPGGAWGELTLHTTAGTGYILLSGQNGHVRADGGFSVSGSIGQTEYFQAAGGTWFRFVGGIYCGH